MNPESISAVTKVTPLSKAMAAILFIAMPFVGLYIGYTFAPEKVVIETVYEQATENQLYSIERVLNPLHNMFDETKSPLNLGHVIIDKIDYNQLGLTADNWIAFAHTGKLDTAGPLSGSFIVSDGSKVEVVPLTSKSIADFRWVGPNSFEYKTFLWCSFEDNNLLEDQIPSTDPRCNNFKPNDMLPLVVSDVWVKGDVREYIN
jgi:hypothetical protein